MPDTDILLAQEDDTLPVLPGPTVSLATSVPHRDSDPLPSDLPAQLESLKCQLTSLAAVVHDLATSCSAQPFASPSLSGNPASKGASSEAASKGLMSTQEPQKEIELKAGSSSAHSVDDSIKPTGCRLIDLNLLDTLIGKLLCPKCKQQLLTIEESKRLGLNCHLQVNCQGCAKTVAEMTTSKVVGRHKTAASNLSLVASSRNCGTGHSRLVRFFSGMNVPQPLHFTTYGQSIAKVHACSQESMEECYQTAARAIRLHYMEQDVTLTDDSVSLTWTSHMMALGTRGDTPAIMASVWWWSFIQACCLMHMSCLTSATAVAKCLRMTIHSTELGMNVMPHLSKEP